MNYFSGVYIPDTTTGLLGGHCVKIVGWGEDAGEEKGEGGGLSDWLQHMRQLWFCYSMYTLWLCLVLTCITQACHTGPLLILGDSDGVRNSALFISSRRFVTACRRKGLLQDQAWAERLQV